MLAYPAWQDAHMTLDIRFGTSADTASVADFILAAGSGIFEQLFEGLLPGMTARDVVRVAVADDGSPLNFSNAILIEENDVALGCALCYPAEDYGLPPVVRSMLPNKRLKPLKELFESRLDGTFYINTLVVAEEARGRGIARLLLETVVGVAEESGAEALSLHAWVDNAPAMALYRSFGFEVVGTIAIEPTKHLHHAGPMAVMRAPLSLRAEAAAPC